MITTPLSSHPPFLPHSVHTLPSFSTHSPHPPLLPHSQSSPSTPSSLTVHTLPSFPTHPPLLPILLHIPRRKWRHQWWEVGGEGVNSSPFPFYQGPRSLPQKWPLPSMTPPLLHTRKALWLPTKKLFPHNNQSASCSDHSDLPSTVNTMILIRGKRFKMQSLIFLTCELLQ